MRVEYTLDRPVQVLLAASALVAQWSSQKKYPPCAVRMGVGCDAMCYGLIRPANQVPADTQPLPLPPQPLLT